MLAMETYGQDVYVASVCLEANYAQVMKAFAEAEAHKGVSLIVAYAPCVMQVRLLCDGLVLLTLHTVTSSHSPAAVGHESRSTDPTCAPFFSFDPE